MGCTGSKEDKYSVIPIKCVVVGDNGVGKTSLIEKYVSDEEKDRYHKKHEEFCLYNTTIMPDNKNKFIGQHDDNYGLIMMDIWDTIGEEVPGEPMKWNSEEGYRREKSTMKIPEGPLSYPQTDVFLVCFSVERTSSFSNVKSRWFPEIRQHYPNTPIVIVATQTDLRARYMITAEEGKNTANELGATDYLECSALKGEGVERVFDQTIRAAITHVENRTNEKKKLRRWCL